MAGGVEYRHGTNADYSTNFRESMSESYREATTAMRNLCGKAVTVTCLFTLCGCGYPTMTGGKAQFDIYKAPPEIESFLTPDPEKELPLLIARSKPTSRAVVIPRYEYVRDIISVFPAQLLTSESKDVLFEPKLQWARWGGPRHPDDYTPDRPYLTAWVFVDGAWPVFVRESWNVPSKLMTSNLWDRWWWKEPDKVPPGKEARATVVCINKLHPWDDEVSATAGCLEYTYHVASRRIDEKVGDSGYTTLWAMSIVPCPFLESIDCSRALSDTDRLFVFKQILLLYEQTKAHWMSGKAPVDESPEPRPNKEAYEKNTALLKERITRITGKAFDVAASKPVSSSRAAPKIMLPGSSFTLAEAMKDLPEDTYSLQE